MVRLSKKIILLIFLLSSHEVMAKNPPPGTGTSDVPANILIMLDNSGSMSRRLVNSVQVDYPLDSATDSNGNVYVLEYRQNRIKVFDSSGNYLRSFGSNGYGCNQWRFARQFDIYNDEIYLADTYNHQIIRMSLTGKCIAKESAGSNYPHAIAADNAYVYVGYTSWSGQGRYITAHYRHRLNYHRVIDTGNAGLRYSWGMSLNSGGNRLIVADYVRNQLYEFSVSNYQSTNSNVTLSVRQRSNSSRSSSNGYFQNPTDAAYDSNGNIYATDLSNHRLQKFNSSMVYQSKVGSYQTTSGFRYPYGIHVDSNDNIYVADYYNLAVRKYNTSLTETATFGGGSGTLMDAAKKVIKKIVSNTDLTSGANFGLMEWSTTRSSDTRIRVKIADTGASRIFNDVDNVQATGYTTDLNYALNLARNYFTSNQVANWNLSCSLNYLIAISDGYWSNHNGVLGVAEALNKQHNIKTFAVGFALSGANNNYKTLAEKGGTTSPLYATNEAELLAKLTDAIKQAISGRLTFTTPAVMSDVQKGDFVYQSTFEYEKNKQWKGSVKKYKLNTDGSFGAVQWDAADKLNRKNASSRKIWTAGINTSGTNNFTTSNRNLLKPLLFPNSNPTDTQVDNLINFIRGVDTYDQDADNNKTESIHKLADIYHSNLVVVGAPEGSIASSSNANFDKTDTAYRINNNYQTFKNNNKNREELIYAGANNGILHAFKTSDGEELWGFIPPVLHENFERIPSSKANATNPIYGVDGSPVVKDIYFDDTPNDNVNNPRWRTVLISGLGAGGNGIFALDVTDINNPTQLFAIKNDPTNKVVTHWNSNGNKNEFGYVSGNINANMDYRKLGETWSTPRIIRIKVSGVDKWVAVFGAGYNGTVNPDVGSAVFVMDLEDEGRLLKKIDIEDQANVMHGYVFGTAINNTKTEFNLSNYGLQSYNTSCCKLRLSGHGDLGYKFTGDLNGDTMRNIKLTFDQAPPDRTNFIVSLVNKTDIVNSIPADISLVTADGTDKANYNGAIAYVADLEGKVTKINLTDKGTLYDKTTLFNAQSTSDNGRYIYTRPNITINNDNNLWLYFGTGNTQKLQEQSSNIQNRLYGIKDTNFPNFTSVSAGDVSRCKTAPNCPGPSDLGWYVNLQNAQKLTAEPTVDKNRVYFPIYEPTKSTNACNTGKAILTGYDTKCGNSVLNVNMGTGVLSKVVVQGDNLYVGIAGEANKNIKGFTSSENLITGKSEAKGTGKVQIEAWREVF